MLGCSDAMRKLANPTTVNCKTIVVDTPNARYGAMAVIFFGFKRLGGGFWRLHEWGSGCRVRRHAAADNNSR